MTTSDRLILNGLIVLKGKKGKDWVSYEVKLEKISLN